MTGRQRAKWWEDRDQSDRCEALMLDCYGHRTANRCNHFCSVTINGDGELRRLCLKHAQMVAMAHAFTIGIAKPIARTCTKIVLQTKVDYAKE